MSLEYAVTKQERHPPFEQLADLAEGRVTDAPRRLLLEHLSTCASCSEQYAWLQRTINLMRTDDTEDAPDWVISSVVKRFRPPEPQPSALRRILASLNFDSARMQPAFGVRSGQPVGRQLLFNAGDFDLDLRVAPEGDQWKVSGQVLGPCDDGEVELAGTAGALRATFNELCEFVLPPAPAGIYTLLLRIRGAEVEVDGLEIGT